MEVKTGITEKIIESHPWKSRGVRHHEVLPEGTIVRQAQAYLDSSKLDLETFGYEVFVQFRAGMKARESRIGQLEVVPLSA